MVAQVQKDRPLTTAVKSMLRGAGSLLQIAPPRRRPRLLTKYTSTRQSDMTMLRSDWHRVGGDLNRAINSERPRLDPSGHGKQETP